MRRRAGLAGLFLGNAAGSFLLPATALLTGPILARALGPDGRGTLVAVIAPTTLAVSLLGFGLPAACVYFGSRGESARRIISYAFVGVGVGSVIGIVVLLALRDALLENYPSAFLLYTVVMCTIPLALAVEVLRSSAQGLGRISLPIVERTLSVVLRALAIVGLFMLGNLTVPTATAAAWGPVVIVVAVYAALYFRRSSPSNVTGTYVASSQGGFARVFIAYAARTWFGAVAGILILRLDQVVLLFLTSPEEVGFYVVALSVSEVLFVAVVATRDVIISSGASGDRRGVTEQVGRLLMLVVGPATLLVIIISPVAIPLLFGSEFMAAVLPTQILLAGSFVGCFGVVAGAGLAGLGRPGLFSWSQVVGLVVNVPALVLLAPVLGGVGGAIASLSAYVGMSSIAVALYVRCAGTGVGAVLIPRRSDVHLLRGIVIRLVRSSG